MADLAGILAGGGGSFTPDARFAGLRGLDDELPGPLSVMRMRFAPITPPEAEPTLGVLVEDEVSPEPDPIETARSEAYTRGWSDAHAAAIQAAAMADETRGQMEIVLRRLDGQLAEQFRQRLMETVIALCESCLAPLALDKDALMRRVERAAAMFNRADDDRVIRMHPEDLSAIQSRLPKDWEVQGDFTMERGAIRVESRSGGIETGGAEDGPEQWRRAIIAALDIGGLD